MELAKKFQKDGKRVNELKQVYITCACRILRNMQQSDSKSLLPTAKFASANCTNGRQTRNSAVMQADGSVRSVTQDSAKSES